jgi:tetratricopeptide (TPR) repeat protein
MKRVIPLCRGVLIAGLAALAGCAQVPAAPEGSPQRPIPRSLHDEELARALSKHRQLATQYRQSGDLAAAATQLQIVALLSPEDEAARRELTSLQGTIDRQVQEHMSAGNGAMSRGDMDRAADEMLKVLALDHDNRDAAKLLREVEKRRQSKIQAARVARVNAAAGQTPPAARPAPAASGNGNGLDIELPLEIFKAGDTTAGLRDLKRFVDANPGDRAARQRIGTVVYDKGRELEDKGSREQALSLYEQAIALRGDAGPGWNARVQALRRALGDEHYQKGVRLYPADASQAIKEWEASLRYDPQNTKSAARLRDARQSEKKR